MGSLVMASMGLNGFDKGLNWSSDNEFFFNGFDRGLLCFFFFLTVDYGLLVVVVVSGVCSAVVGL